MTVQVQGPGGISVQFPDGMTVDQMSAIMQQHFGTPQPKAASAPSPMQGGINLAYQAAEGIPLAGALPNKIYAATAAALQPVLGTNTASSQAPTFGQRYAENEAWRQSQDAAMQAAHPIVSETAGLAGGLAAGGGLLSAAPKVAEALTLGAKTIPQAVVAGAGTTGAISGADALLRGQNPVPATYTGAALGAGLPAAAGVAGRIGRALERAPSVPQNAIDVAGVEIPISQGQANPSDLLTNMKEKAALGGGMGELPQKLAREFADKQAAAVSQAKEAITEKMNPPGTEPGSGPIAEDPQAAAQIAGQAIQRAAAASKGAYQEAYGKFAETPGAIDANALKGLGDQIREKLSTGASPVFIDKETTPYAARALADIDANVGSLRFENLAIPRGASIRAMTPEEMAGPPKAPPQTDLEIAQHLDNVQSTLKAAYVPTDPGFTQRAAEILKSGGASDPWEAYERAIVEEAKLLNPRGAAEILKGTPYEANLSPNPVQANSAREYGGGDRAGQSSNTATATGGTGQLLQSGGPARGLGAQGAGETATQTLGGAPPSAPAGAPTAAPEESISLQQIDQARKRLISMASDARRSGNASDSRAMQRIIESFDNHLGDAFEEGLFSGDESAYPTLKEARAAFSQHQQRFASRDDVGRAMQKILGKDDSPPATPTEISNYLYGASNIGEKGLSVRLAQRLKGILGEDSPAWAAIKQGLFSKMVEPPEGMMGWGPQKIAQRLGRFLTGDGKPMADAVFSQDELGDMQDFHRALSALIPPAGSVNTSDTAPVAKLIRGGLNLSTPLLAEAIGSQAGMHGAGLGALAVQQIAEKLREHAAVRTIGQSLYGQPRPLQALAPSNALISSILAQTAREQAQKEPAKAF